MNIKTLLLIIGILTSNFNSFAVSQIDTAQLQRDSVNYEVGRHIKRSVNFVVFGAIITRLGLYISTINFDNTTTKIVEQNYDGKTIGLMIALLGGIMITAALVNFYRAGNTLQFFGSKRKKKKKQ
jgi:uncharacterized membrane protein YidH (DUF202 family)